MWRDVLVGTQLRRLEAGVEGVGDVRLAAPDTEIRSGGRRATTRRHGLTERYREAWGRTRMPMEGQVGTSVRARPSRRGVESMASTLKSGCDRHEGEEDAPLTSRRRRKRWGAPPGRTANAPGAPSRRLLLDRFEQRSSEILAPRRRCDEKVFEIARGSPGPGRGMDDAIGHPDPTPRLVEPDQPEHAVPPLAHSLEGGSPRLLLQLGAVEVEIRRPERVPVVPVVTSELPDGAHPASFASTASGG